MNSDRKKLDKLPIIPSEYPSNFPISSLNSWQIAWKVTSDRNWWQLCLIAIASASSIIYYHVPLVSFAAVTGNTLTRKKALITAMSIWFASQLYGFIIRQYPLTLESLTWGLVMGLGVLLVTWLVTIRPQFSCYNFQGYLIWLAIAVVGGYAIYQGSIFLVAQLMGGHGLTAEILGRIFVRDVIWAVGLSGIHSSLIWLLLQKRSLL